MSTKLKKKLEEYIRNHPPCGDPEEQEFEELQKIEKEKREKALQRDPTIAKIPPFYIKKERTLLNKLLIHEAQIRLIERKKKLLLDETELTYEYFQTLANQFPPEKAMCYFCPTTFIKFERDHEGRISNQEFFEYILKKLSLINLRMDLIMYDSNGEGYLTESDLENYIMDCIPKMESLRSLQRSMLPSYIVMAMEKFKFFFNFRRKMPIIDLIASPVTNEFSQLLCEGLDHKEELANWFSAPTFLSVIDLFQRLDKYGKGTLSKLDLLDYNEGSLTPAFVNHLFQEYPTINGEMDFKFFVDLLLALENKNSDASIRYLWKVLDIDKKGYITDFELQYFFRGILDKLRRIIPENELPLMDDVITEIYAMISPKDGQKITLQDLLNCKCGGTVISMIIDVHGFCAYDQRENAS